METREFVLYHTRGVTACEPNGARHPWKEGIAMQRRSFLFYQLAPSEHLFHFRAINQGSFGKKKKPRAPMLDEG